MENNITAISVKEATAEEVRALMARRRITQRQLSADLGWSAPYLSRRVTGETEFSVYELITVCLALDADPVDVLTVVARPRALAAA